MSNQNLPIIHKTSLPMKIEETFKNMSRDEKTKFFGSMTGLFAAGFIGCSFFSAPAIAIASLTGELIYNGMNLLNNSVFVSYKDLILTCRKDYDKIKIIQDLLRPDILTKLIGKSKFDKLAFLQLQAIVGISKLKQISSIKSDVENPIFKTSTHGVLLSTFKRLEKLGLIDELSIAEKKNIFGKPQNKSHFLEKLAIGNANPKNLFIKKEPLSDVTFKLGKNINIDSDILKKSFPNIFGKDNNKSHIGLLAKYNWNIIENDDGTLSIDYNSSQNSNNKSNKNIESNVSKSSRTDFIKDLQKDTPSIEEQNEFSNSYIKNQAQKQEVHNGLAISDKESSEIEK